MLNQELILANKPSGVNTHRVAPEKPGYCEWLENKLNKKLYVVHRLDKETSGCMIFATSKESAAHLTEQFTHHHIKKTYLFITDRKPQQKEWQVESEIQQVGKIIKSNRESNQKNSKTVFRWLNDNGSYYLIEAQPHSGKTHQIRIHAQDSQVSLLGDTTYGGTPFPHFFLHSLSIATSDNNITRMSEPPLVFKQLDLLKRPQLCQWLMSYDRRQRLYPELLNSNQCLRLIHNEGTPLRADLLGEAVHAGWWQDREPSEKDIQDVEDFFKLIGIPHWSLQSYKKQKNNSQPLQISHSPNTWTGFENEAQFCFKQDVGTSSPGLFLDQRDQRLWVKNHSQNKSVLNLFAYTGGFSLMAALGGASSVVTVDLYKKYVEWSKENFKLNKLSPENYKFYDMDSQEYLKYAAKKNLKFDLIICDPPSFSRNKSQIFQIEKDYVNLIQKMKGILAPKGVILFSTNFEQWDGTVWEKAISDLCRAERLEFARILSNQWDFETDPTSSLMKAFQLRN